MIQTGTCVPTPGLKRALGVYACATGVLYPQVLVDPMVRTLPGEQALVAHEMAHVEGRHALKFIVAVVVAVLLHGLVLTTEAAVAYEAVNLPLWTRWLLWAFACAWSLNIPFFLRWCEIEADRYALFRTDAKTFIAFLHLHPHPTGRWGRWLYGSTLEARIRRSLPKQ